LKIYEGVQLIIEGMPTRIYNNKYQSNIFYKPIGNNSIYYGSDPNRIYNITTQEFNSVDGNNGDVITGNLDDDPMFVDPSNPAGPDGIYWTADDGYMLNTGSPAINAGVDVGLPYLGSAPDIGAYEQ
jgi:hypothetical protein